MARRKQYEDDDNLDRWLISYADFITLLFAFFVVMFAVSSLDEGKYKEVTQSLVTAFNATPKSLEPIQVGEISRDNQNDVIETPNSNEQQKKENNGDIFSDKANQIQQKMMDLIKLEELTLTRSDDWLEVEINTKILFNSGDSNLVETAIPILTKVATILAPYPNPINVEGFTDNIPINTTRYASNWELSAARAATVVHLFSKAGVEPNRLSAIAYGEFRPKSDNKSVKGRLQNRRVIIAILAQDIGKTKSNRKNAVEVEDKPKIRHSDLNSIRF